MSGTDAERIVRLERMVFLMLSIMNGTIFAGGPGVGNFHAFGATLEELWRLQTEGEEIEPIEPDDAIPKRPEEERSA